MHETTWLWRIGAPVVRGILSIVFRVRVSGTERIPRQGAAIVACNHMSVLDGPFLASFTHAGGREPSFLIAAEVFDHPLLGGILHTAHQIPIRRGEGDDDALGEALTTVAQGGCVGIFPEGRVADDAGRGLQRIRSGVTRIALPTGAPVVPVGIWGTQAVWPRGRRYWRRLASRPRVGLAFGAPIEPEGDDGEPDAHEAFQTRLHDAITSQVARARALAEADGR